MTDSLHLVLSSPTETFTFSTDKTKVRIGRSLNCEFVVTKDDLSREHCLFEKEGDRFFITDLGSKNGVCVDRVRLSPQEKREIKEGSLIVLSNLYTLRLKSWDAGMADQETNQTQSFELERPAEGPRIRKKSIKKASVKGAHSKEQNSQESARMIIGFLIILGIALYHALGK